jgi:hypothetical protein
MIVMHPLPRVNEIDTAVDVDPRAAYFRFSFCLCLLFSFSLINLISEKANGKRNVHKNGITIGNAIKSIKRNDLFLLFVREKNVQPVFSKFHFTFFSEQNVFQPYFHNNKIN